MNKLNILILSCLLVATDINLPKNADLPSNIKAYGTINFGDSKDIIQSKLRSNEIYRNKDSGAYIVQVFDTPFEIDFIYGTNERRPTFLKTMRLGLHSIVDSHIINEVIEVFDEQYGPSEKYYINIYRDSKEYFRWEKDDRVIHLDFDGVNIDITINSKHFNSLSKTYIEKDIEEEYKKKLERKKKQLEKLL
ncbi:MAG: hypothetical protein CMG13_05935 [Candidatus Marinimicrobia bacterium]|nr:hypothetical protein [Candidatus Neomarinimicrobiota bacterium]|tara:strand:+ start:1718 stop:2293 length:576 start_codon:yes stop_codon:yes gene_type:complete